MYLGLDTELWVKARHEEEMMRAAEQGHRLAAARGTEGGGWRRLVARLRQAFADAGTASRHRRTDVVPAR